MEEEEVLSLRAGLKTLPTLIGARWVTAVTLLVSVDARHACFFFLFFFVFYAS